MTNEMKALGHPNTTILRSLRAMVPLMMATLQRKNKNKTVHFSSCPMSFSWKLLHVCVHQMNLGMSALSLSKRFLWFQNEFGGLLRSVCP